MYMMAIIIILPVCMIDYGSHHALRPCYVATHPSVGGAGIMALCPLCPSWLASLGRPIFPNVSLKLMSFENIIALKNSKKFGFGWITSYVPSPPYTPLYIL